MVNLVLHPNPADKAAAIIENIVNNHPFTDGNKRTGYTHMHLVLLKSKLDIEATEKEKYDFVINIAEGKLDLNEIKFWIEIKLKKE